MFSRIFISSLAIAVSAAVSQSAFSSSVVIPPASAPMLPDVERIFGADAAVDFLQHSEYSGEASRFDLRRVHLGGSMIWERNWSASLTADLSHSGALGQASLVYSGLPLYLELGRFPEPFGLLQQEVTSNQLMMEVPALLALTPSYGLGVGVSMADSRSSLSLGIFTDADLGQRLERRPPESAATVRLTGLPLVTSESVVHLGASFSLRRPHEDVLSFVALPETVLLRDFTIESAPLQVDQYALLGAEAGLSSGPWILRGEQVIARLPAIAGTHPSLTGAYVEAAVTIGALHRGYIHGRGAFGNTFPSHPLGQGGWGAVELATRYSKLDVTSNDLGDVAASGGHPSRRDLFSGERGEIRGWGLNWYPTDEVKISLNRLAIEVSSRSETERATVIQGRLQIQFWSP